MGRCCDEAGTVGTCRYSIIIWILYFEGACKGPLAHSS